MRMLRLAVVSTEQFLDFWSLVYLKNTLKRITDKSHRWVGFLWHTGVWVSCRALAASIFLFSMCNKALWKVNHVSFEQ